MLVCRPSRMVQNRYVSLGLASGTEDAAYPLTCLVDATNPAKCARFTDAPVVAIRVVWDHGEDVRIDAVSLAKFRLDVGLGVRVQRHTANAWGAPTQDAALPIAANHEDGHSPSPWVDLRAVEGYREQGFRFSSIYVPVNSTSPRLAGLVFVEQFEALDEHIDTMRRGERRRFIAPLETEAGVRRYLRRRVKERYLRGHGMPEDAALASWLAVLRDADGPCLPFLFIWDESDTTDGALLVRPSDATAEALEWDDTHPAAHAVTLEFDEVSRGLPIL